MKALCFSLFCWQAEENAWRDSKTLSPTDSSHLSTCIKTDPKVPVSTSSQATDYITLLGKEPQNNLVVSVMIKWFRKNYKDKDKLITLVFCFLK
jgi:hypothetical protein